MLKLILSASVATIVAASLAANAQQAPVDPEFNAKPVFPAIKADKPDVVPADAQFKITSGKSFRYVACNGGRVVASTHEEKWCVTFSKTKGWSKKPKFIPAYQLLPLNVVLASK
jgi:hypothetical protein